MTQVEVPQLSLQRYFDLLKRRRWQVVPVSLLGLLLGGLVAFFIPRYYVADTTLQHQQVPGQPQSRNVDDPFRSIVDTARLTIPLAVGETMKKLNWPDAQIADLFERTQRERVVMERVVVSDTNQLARDRDWAQIRVTYRDRDGERSSTFLNALIETWIEKRLGELRAPAEEERRLANEVLNRTRASYDQLVTEKAALERQYDFDPGEDLVMLQLRLVRDEQKTPRAELAAKQRERDVARALLQQSRDLLNNTVRRVAPEAESLLEKASKTPEGVMLIATLMYSRAALENLQPGTTEHASHKRAIAEAEKRLRLLVSDGQADADGLVPNPAYEKQLADVTGREQELLLLEAACTGLEAQVAAESVRQAYRIEGMVLYTKKVTALEETKKNLELANETLREADAVLGALSRRQTVQQVARASPPPRPTEPNILIIALIGCALGLGVAIALILLLDVVKGTFKTIDEVERGLPVPVLGGTSYLETVAERKDTTRRRRRVSLTAAAFVTGCVAVVTIFYIDPTSLPPLVRDLLALLLGA